MRLKPRITITLSLEQIKILEQYGSKNKSLWIGEVIEQWYLNNISEADRLENKLKWLGFKKKHVEDEIRQLQEREKNLEANKIAQVEDRKKKAIFNSVFF
jgi:hypothetical protein